MKKTILIIFTLCISMVLTAQVGINVPNPNASSALEIKGKNNDKGLLIPRVALTALNSASPIVSPANSLLVYNNATAGTSPNNVTPGYYYWDSTSAKWVRLIPSTDPVVNLYTADGTLAGNRSVTIGSNSLNFDANTLIIKPDPDATGPLVSGVGIGASPTEKLDVAGNVKFSGALMPNNTAGNTNEILKSQGANTTLAWKKEGTLLADNSMNAKIVMSATGGSDLVYTTDFNDDTETDLKLNEVTDLENAYNPTTGIYTIPSGSEGLYYIRGTAVLDKSGGTFDGDGGNFELLLYQEGTELLAGYAARVYRGSSSTTTNDELNCYATIPLKAGSKIQLRFKTYGADNISDPLIKTNTKILRSKSKFIIYKL